MNEEQRQEAIRLFALDMAKDGAAPPSDDDIGRVVNWRELDDNQARAEWVALRSWVEWMTVRYNIPVSMVPACWWQHPALVEELSALHSAHEAAFDERDTGFGPVNWHERFATAQTRLSRAYSGSCSDGHSPRKPRSWSGVTDEDEWDAWTNRAHADQPPRAGNRKEGRP